MKVSVTTNLFSNLVLADIQVKREFDFPETCTHPSSQPASHHGYLHGNRDLAHLSGKKVPHPPILQVDVYTWEMKLWLENRKSPKLAIEGTRVLMFIRLACRKFG